MVRWWRHWRPIVDAVVDANVWLSATDAREPGHKHSARFLREALARQVVFLLPSVLLPEVAGTASRRTQDPSDGLAMIEQLLRLPNARFFDLNIARARAAARLGSMLFLRGADALYAALAVEHHASLVTLDRELRKRNAGQFECLTPEEWVARFV